MKTLVLLGTLAGESIIHHLNSMMEGELEWPYDIDHCKDIQIYETGLMGPLQLQLLWGRFQTVQRTELGIGL